MSKKIILMLTTILLLSLIVACGSGSPNIANVATVEVTEPQRFSYLVNVQAKETGENIRQAKIMIQVPGKPPLDEVTDSTGVARIFIEAPFLEQPGKLIVEAIGYERYVQNIDLIEGKLPDVVLLDPLPTPTLTPVPTETPITPTPTNTFTPNPPPSDTPTLEPTPGIPTPTPTAEPPPIPTPRTIDNMDSTLDWIQYVDDKGSTMVLRSTPGMIDNGVEISFDLKQDGYVGISKEFYPGVLSGTDGIKFSYNGSGAPNTIEFKLLYAPDTKGKSAVFSASWHHITATNSWKTFKIPYSQLGCWVDTGCAFDEQIDLEKVWKIDFAISNKLGDTPGIGVIVLDNVIALSEPETN